MLLSVLELYLNPLFGGSTSLGWSMNIFRCLTPVDLVTTHSESLVPILPSCDRLSLLARKYLANRKEVMFAVTTDVLALVMYLFGMGCGAVIAFMYRDLEKHEKNASRDNHPTSVVTPESLHATFQQVMTDTVFTVQALARDAEAQDWYWSHDYYKRQAMHMREIMLPYDYYVKGDLKKTPHK